MSKGAGGCGRNGGSGAQPRFIVPQVGEVVPSGPWEGFEIISAYSREQAIADGVIVDVSETAREAGYQVPVALTRAVFDLVEPNEGERTYGQDLQGRLWDTLWMARMAARQANRDGEGRFQCIFVTRNRDRFPGMRKPHVELKVTLDATGEGDTALTIAFPEED